MMKRKDKRRTKPNLDMVGVAGSTPVGPTNLAELTQSQIVEIPNDYEIVPASRWVDGRLERYRVAIKKSSVSGDFPVTKKSRKKSA